MLLSFYRFTREDLAELKKLSVLASSGKVVLWTPEQVRTELRRNREDVIAKSINELRSHKLKLSFPAMCKGYPEYQELQKLQEQYKDRHTVLVSSIQEDASERNLDADHVIDDLLSKAKNIRTTKSLIEKAECRKRVGNPPGKKESKEPLGDEINWEALLEAIPREDDLILVSEDKDYASPMDRQKLNDFLLDEWQRKRGSEIEFHTTISSLFRSKFPQIKLTPGIELEKELLVQDLADSASFSETHQVIAKLRQQSNFSDLQKDVLISAAVYNSQIKEIIGDADIRRFFIRLLDDTDIEEDTLELKRLKSLMKISS